MKIRINYNDPTESNSRCAQKKKKNLEVIGINEITRNKGAHLKLLTCDTFFFFFFLRRVLTPYISYAPCRRKI